MYNEKRIRWLQLSDLHIFYSTEWEIMLKSYEELSKVFKPNFIVVTGDYRHIVTNKSYDNALRFLSKLAEIFSLTKADFFFVPGNHDVSHFHMRDEIIAKIRHDIEENPDCYLEYNDRLQKGFKNYNDFVRKFYGDSLAKDDDRINNPSSVYVIQWKKKINIVTLNTALISNGAAERFEIVDIRKLSQIATQIDKSKPTIVLAHHAPSALVTNQRAQLERLLEMIKARVYLCGDEHRIGRIITNKFDAANQTVGIICGKSAVEPSDTYSDICVIGYTWQGGYTSVEVFKWLGQHAETPYQFIRSDTWYHHIDKPFSFKMVNGNATSPSITEQMDTVWEDFLRFFEKEDQLINKTLGEKQVANKSGNSEPFSSEKIMRSLIIIGIPFPAVSEITQKTIETLLGSVPANASEWVLDTKTIRLKVLEAIRALDGAHWATDKVGNWCIKYIRRYGHNNRIIELYNIPHHLNTDDTTHVANYKFIKEVFIPDLFQTICQSFDMKRVTNSQKTNLAEEIISFINGCDLYMIDYTVLKQMVLEIVTKPPHPWIIDNQRRDELVAYDRHSVESNLQELARCEDDNIEIPLAVFVELLHHVSAMMLDRYFDFCGCADLEAFNILVNCFKHLLDSQLNPKDWDLMNESQDVKSLYDDFIKHGVSISAYYGKLCAINPHNVQMSNTRKYIAAIKDFANESLRIIDQLESH